MINSSVTEIPTTLQPSTKPTNSSSLKLGLIIGCAVAAVVIVACLIVILWLCVRWRKRIRREAGIHASDQGLSECWDSVVFLGCAAPDEDFGDDLYECMSFMDEYEAPRIQARAPLPQVIKAAPHIQARAPLPQAIIAAPRTLEREPVQFGIAAPRIRTRELAELRVEAAPRTLERAPLPQALIAAPRIQARASTMKVIATDGSVLNCGNFTLKIGPGCLSEDTFIALTEWDQDFTFKTLLNLSLVDTIPHVVEFFPGGLVFQKPADVMIRLERKTVPESEHFILHGSYNLIYAKTIWELVTNGIDENSEEGVITMKINHFSLLTYIKAKRGKLARILGHLNGYFTCSAYSFYRRMPAMDTIDISVVLLSEFVAQNLKEEDIEQLKDHFEAGYVKGEKGFLKAVHTNRHLEVILDFPGIENPPFLFKVRQDQLDSVGFVVDRFKRIAMRSPAIGAVKISEIKSRAKKESLWELNVCEIEDEIRAEEQPAPLDLPPEAQLAPLDVPPEEQPAAMDLLPEAQHAPLDVKPEGIHRSTKLAVREIDAMSPKVGIDWDNLAALMDIPYSEREEIRVNYQQYPSLSSKAKRVFELYNESKGFDRHILVKHLKELQRQDLINEMPALEDEGKEVGPGATAMPKPEISEVQAEISDVQAEISDVQQQISDVQPQISEVKPQTSEVKLQTSEVKPQTSEVKPQISEVQPEILDVQPQISEVLTQISDVQPEISEVQLKNDIPLSNSESQEVVTAATATPQPGISAGQLPNDTPLSSREMYMLSRHLVVTWDRLAALLDITASERQDIRYSLLYISSHSKAEKMLAIFNNMEDFSRQRLAECFEEIGQLELKEPVITGEWRR